MFTKVSGMVGVGVYQQFSSMMGLLDLNMKLQVPQSQFLKIPEELLVSLRVLCGHLQQIKGSRKAPQVDTSESIDVCIHFFLNCKFFWLIYRPSMISMISMTCFLFPVFGDLQKCFSSWGCFHFVCAWTWDIFWKPVRFIGSPLVVFL